MVEELGLARGDLADGGEDVGFARGDRLHRVLGAHAAGFGGFLGRTALEAGLGRLAAGGDRAAEDRRVGGENSPDVGGFVLEMEEAGGRHPLVELRHGAKTARGHALAEPLLDDDAGGVAEEHGLVVVPAAEERIDLVMLPESGEHGVLLGEEAGELDEDRARTTGDLPTADADRHAERATALAEVGEALLFLEPLVATGEEPRTDRDVVVAEAGDEGLRLRRDDRVDAADLVADFPGDFEEGVGSGHRVVCPGRHRAEHSSADSAPNQSSRSAERLQAGDGVRSGIVESGLDGCPSLPDPSLVFPALLCNHGSSVESHVGTHPRPRRGERTPVRFQPRFCPRPDCPSRASGHRRWCFKGRFHRACDGRTVQRFLCLECRRTFSTQTFRVDYRLKKPKLNLSLFGPFISKVTHRQAARVLGCSRRTVAHRLALLGDHCRRFHRWRLSQVAGKLDSSKIFQLDELETFEHSRRLTPVTMPVLIERSSYFVLDLATAPLPCRGGLSRGDRLRKEGRERLLGRRRSGSRRAVEHCVDTLAGVLVPSARVRMQTDRKATYATILQGRFGIRLAHQRHSSREKRDYKNPLFPINHTLAMMRAGISRLVRRTWGASKLRERLEHHAWIWVAWRNYVRGITNLAPRVTPAMALGVEEKRWTVAEIGAWRVFAST